MNKFLMSERRGYRTIPKKGGVYRIRNIKTGQRYIGSGKSLLRRGRSHAHALSPERRRKWSPAAGRHLRHANTALDQSVERYGLDAHVFEVLAFVDDKNERLRLEHTLIQRAGDEAFNTKRNHWLLQPANQQE